MSWTGFGQEDRELLEELDGREPTVAELDEWLAWDPTAGLQQDPFTAIFGAADDD